MVDWCALGPGAPHADGQGDDATPELTSAQAQLVDDLKATGKPVIVVVVAGRPLVMNGQLDEADASLMAFLPGSEGGAAVADALFGKVNPSGRLPVSWPKASSQLPLAYNEPGKAYDPRYPFGYGLSYTRFDLRNLRAPWHVGADDWVNASVKVRNAGRRSGDDTVLAFVVRPDGGPSSWPSRGCVWTAATAPRCGWDSARRSSRSPRPPASAR